MLIYLVGFREEGGGRYGGNSVLGEVVEFCSLLVLILRRNRQRVNHFCGQRVIMIDNKTQDNRVIWNMIVCLCKLYVLPCVYYALCGSGLFYRVPYNK